MEVAALRTFGLVAGAAALSSALTIAVLSGCDAQAPTPPPTAVSQPPAPPPITDPADGGTLDPATAAPIDGEPVAEPAAVDAPPPRLSARPSFLIRFEPSHPIARAHALAATDQQARSARNAVLAGLRARREMDGLCFKGFTLGGQEVILEACSDVADPAAFERRWVRRFQTMRGVDYAEPNHVAQPDARR